MALRLSAYFAGAFLLAAASSASAMDTRVTSPQGPQSSVIPVVEFCGIGFHRGPSGECLPGGIVTQLVNPGAGGPQVAVAPVAACPGGTHFTSDGRACLPN